MAKEVISREEKDLELIVDLDKANTEQPLLLDVPITHLGGYIHEGNKFDGFGTLRNCYRYIIGRNQQLLALHESYLQNILQDARSYLSPIASGDPLEYLITNGKQRKKHNWLGSNEVVMIDGWVLPAYALEQAVVPKDFMFQHIGIVLKRGDKVTGEVSYKTRDVDGSKDAKRYVASHRLARLLDPSLKLGEPIRKEDYLSRQLIYSGSSISK